MTDPIVPGGAGLPDQQSGPPDASPPPAQPEPTPPPAEPALDSAAGFGMPAGFGAPPADAPAPSDAAWGAPSAPAAPSAPPADTWGAPSTPAPDGTPAGGWAPGTALKPTKGARGSGRLRVIIIAVVIIGIVVAAVIFGALGPSAVGDLKVGDCFDVPTGLSESDTVDTVQHHPCNQSHTGEVIFVGDYTGGTDAYPATSDFDTFVGNTCGPAFQDYVGTSLDADTDLSIGYFYPLEDSWSSGERSVTCYATRTDDAPMTSSVKGSGSGTPAGSSTP